MRQHLTCKRSPFTRRQPRQCGTQIGQGGDKLIVRQLHQLLIKPGDKGRMRCQLVACQRDESVQRLAQPCRRQCRQQRQCRLCIGAGMFKTN